MTATITYTDGLTLPVVAAAGGANPLFKSVGDVLSSVARRAGWQ